MVVFKQWYFLFQLFLSDTQDSYGQNPKQAHFQTVLTHGCIAYACKNPIFGRNVAKMEE